MGWQGPGVILRKPAMASRALRADAGQVRITPRDVEVMTFHAEQGRVTSRGLRSIRNPASAGAPAAHLPEPGTLEEQDQDRQRRRARLICLVVFAALLLPLGACSGSSDVSLDPEECERQLDEFEETRRRETLEARERVIELQKRLTAKNKISDEEVGASLRRIRGHMDAAVQQVGCE